MENVLAAFFAIFITLFAALSLSSTAMSSQETLRASSQIMQARMDNRTKTDLVSLEGHFTHSGSVVEVIYHNQGTTKLADFAGWDAIVQYTDNATAPSYHVHWLPYSTDNTDNSANNEWVVSGIYMNAARDLAAIYDRGIVDPGEDVKVSLHLSPAVGAGTTLLLALGTTNGVVGLAQVHRSLPPVLKTNAGITAATGSTTGIGKAQLEVTDTDTTPDALLYTVTTAPGLGTLSLGQSFTQADINNNLLTYSRAATGDDQFQFTVTNGDTTIGPSTFTIQTASS